jgi:hypothetical protein
VSSFSFCSQDNKFSVQPFALSNKITKSDSTFSKIGKKVIVLKNRNKESVVHNEGKQTNMIGNETSMKRGCRITNGAFRELLLNGKAWYS